MWNDPLFEDCKKVEPFRDCTLVSCMEGGAENLIASDRPSRSAVFLRLVNASMSVL